jgi:hypothetical protein
MEEIIHECVAVEKSVNFEPRVQLLELDGFCAIDFAEANIHADNCHPRCWVRSIVARNTKTDLAICGI